MKNWKRWGEFIIVIVASLVVLFGSVLSWDWLVYGKNSDILRNVALTIGGIWAAYAVFLAAIRVKIMQQQQVSESLAKAAEQLSSTIMSVRILAILSLGKIAVEADKKICQDVIYVLCAYIREKRPIGKRMKKGYSVFPKDMQTIIGVLSDIRDNKPEYSIGFVDLSGTDLSGVGLSGINLSGVDLQDANLSYANSYWSGANLSGAYMEDANLSRAHLWNTNLSGACLYDVNMSNIDLYESDLSGTDMSGVSGLDTARNLETVKNPPQEIIDEIERQEQSGQSD